LKGLFFGEMKKSGKRKFNAELRNRVVLEVLRKIKTVNQLALQYDIHPSQIMQWKKSFEENSPLIIGEIKSGIPVLNGEKFTSFAILDKGEVEEVLIKKFLL